MAPSSPCDSLTLARMAINTITDKKGLEIIAYDMQKQSAITDCIVIASAQNAPHLKALFNATYLRFKENGLLCFRQSGTHNSGWIMADYFDVIIHLFLPETRKYYDLDQLLQDMPQIRG